MNEQRAREILFPGLIDYGKSFCISKITGSVRYWYGYSDARIEGSFTADELEAIAFWMRREQK